MKCPECGAPIRLIRDGWARLSSPSLCPCCSTPLALRLDLRKAASVFLPIAGVGVLTQPYFGLIGSGLAAGAIVILSMWLTRRT